MTQPKIQGPGTTTYNKLVQPNKVDPLVQMRQLIQQVNRDPFSVKTMPGGSWYQSIKQWHPQMSQAQFQPLMDAYSKAFGMWMNKGNRYQGQQAAGNALNTANNINRNAGNVIQAPRIPPPVAAGGSNSMAKPVYNYPKEVNYSFLTKALTPQQQGPAGGGQGPYVPPGGGSGGGTAPVGGGQGPYVPPVSQPPINTSATVGPVTATAPGSLSIPGIGDIGSIINSVQGQNPWTGILSQIVPQFKNLMGNYFNNSTTSSQYANPYETEIANLARQLQTMNFPALDPAYQANLNTQRDSALAQSKQAFDTRASQQLADLYGRGINRSNVADAQVQALGRDEGLMTGQILSSFAGQENAARVQNWQQQAQQILQSAGILGGLGTENLQVQQAEQGQLGQKLGVLLQILERATGGQIDPLALLQLLLGQKNQDKQFAMQDRGSERQQGVTSPGQYGNPRTAPGMIGGGTSSGPTTGSDRGFGEPIAFADKIAWSNQGNAQFIQQLQQMGLPPELISLLLQNDPAGNLMKIFAQSRPGASAALQIAEQSPRGGGGPY